MPSSFIPSASLTARTYDARGNKYVVASPAALRMAGIQLADDPALAAAQATSWTVQATTKFCGKREPSSKHASDAADGLLVGPFGIGGPVYELLIVNTDGTLAERSGNGLTIFSKALADQGVIRPGDVFDLHVHHSHLGVPTPTITPIEATRTDEGELAFWIDMGIPKFGADAVNAKERSYESSSAHPYIHKVSELARIDDRWQRSVFVRIGNPHCVTLVSEFNAIPSFEAMHTCPLETLLSRIAYAHGTRGSGVVSDQGINLQWVHIAGDASVHAVVFERGEGPTRSSGTSATAVACALWRLGLAQAGLVQVTMPGGTMPIQLVVADAILARVKLLGVARPVCVSSAGQSQAT